jgi:AcrR family transcriptional regulator
VTTSDKRPRRGRPPQGVRRAIVDATLAIISESGASHLTTKEIAERSGASEASIYYHFADKLALVEGVMLAAVLEPLEALVAVFPAQAEGKTPRAALTEHAVALREFWGRVLPIVSAVQSDVALRDEFAARITALGYGPHRGVRVVAEYLAAQQEVGSVRADIDAHQAAMSFAGACFLSAYQRHMFGQTKKLPALLSTIDTLVDLIEN